MVPDSGSLPVTVSAPRRLRVAGIAAAVIVLVVVVAGIVSRAVSAGHVRQWTDEQALPTVAVVTPSGGGEAAALDLPGRLEATSRAPLYARVSGYLKSWKVDIGARVKAGQLLAEIEAPDVEQQLLQAQADLATAEANAALASSTATRYQSMLGTNSVSRQAAEEKAGDLAAKQAVVKAQRANVERLRTMMQFTRIVAPFDGVVTARDTDVGALISAGGSGQELFVVSDTHRLRVYVSVPQVFAGNLAPGTKATISVPERAGKSYPAVVEAASGAVNAATGTTLVQLSVDNAAGDLLPGGYASVRFELPHDASLLRVPASAVIFDHDGLYVATLDAQNRVVLKTVTIARDDGATIQIATGLNANDRVIETPPDGVAAGSVVRVVNAVGAAP
ncbi:MAG TPA: efflux RND transporter periplasmic adaptor subunit [Steroidobacteraceae bacterium]|nr:efflux RND transporter periplasmic adaptor subunit [Steroidobacteraceae bacterium]